MIDHRQQQRQQFFVSWSTSLRCKSFLCSFLRNPCHQPWTTACCLFYLFIYFWWSCTISKTGEKIQVKNNPAETKPRSFPCLFPFSKQSYKICISITDGAVKNAMCKVWHVMKDHMMMLLPKRQMNPHLCMALRFLKDSSASFFFFSPLFPVVGSRCSSLNTH